MLKFMLKKEQLNFMKGWAALEQEMEYHTQIQCSLESDDVHQDKSLLSARSTTNSSHDSMYDDLLKAIVGDECDNIPDVPALFG